jgi:hypothetical protein
MNDVTGCWWLPDVYGCFAENVRWRRDKGERRLWERGMSRQLTLTLAQRKRRKAYDMKWLNAMQCNGWDWTWWMIWGCVRLSDWLTWRREIVDMIWARQSGSVDNKVSYQKPNRQIKKNCWDVPEQAEIRCYQGMDQDGAGAWGALKLELELVWLGWFVSLRMRRKL